jgi:hypothetical protein
LNDFLFNNYIKIDQLRKIGISETVRVKLYPIEINKILLRVTNMEDIFDEFSN